MSTKKAKWYECSYEDDDGKVCGKPMTKHEYDQDDMCSDCAEKLWAWFVAVLKRD